MKIAPEVSIILPCFNEAQHLQNSIEELNYIAQSFDFTYEYIFVDDNSLDATASILKSIENSGVNCKFVYHSVNRGRGGAIKSGYNVASGSIIGYIDIDLEVSPIYISRMVDQLKKYDVVVGNRSYYSQVEFNSLFRNVLSKSYKRISKFVLRHPFDDTETGFKFFRREKVDPFWKSIQNNQWFWDTEFMMSSAANKLHVCEFPVEFVRNHRKKSTVKLFRDTAKYIVELYRYKRRK